MRTATRPGSRLLNATIGDDTSKDWGHAQEIAALDGAAPIFSQAAEKLRAAFAEHVREMRAWGAENGVPKDVLATLPKL